MNDDPAYGQVAICCLSMRAGVATRRQAPSCGLRAAGCGMQLTLMSRGFFAHVAGAPWDEPGVVQILLQEEEDEYFRLYMLCGDGLTEFTPPPEDGWPPASEHPRPDPEGHDSKHAAIAACSGIMGLVARAVCLAPH